MPEGYNQDAQVAPFAQTAAVSAPPVVHVTPMARKEIHYTATPLMNTMPFVNNEVYRPVPPPSESLCCNQKFSLSFYSGHAH